jgi:hypothetical protein
VNLLFTLQLNVILASSEHSFPFRLCNDLKFNIKNFTEFIFAGEIPPNKMFELFTTQWGMGENMALAMVDFYGGHVWSALNAIKKRHINIASDLLRANIGQILYPINNFVVLNDID